MNKIILTSDQLTRLKNGEQVGLCEPLVEQPPDGYEFHYSMNDHTFFRCENPKGEIAINHQYPINKVLGVRETYRKMYSQTYEIVGFLYTDGTKKIIKGAEITVGLSSKKSPRTMPADAIIDHVKVVDNSVKRAQDMTKEEMFEYAGYIQGENVPYTMVKEDVMVKFNSQYAKPRPRREKGKIVRYECWCWDMESWFKWYNEYHNTKSPRKKGYYCGDNENDYWDKKPLEIHVKPFIELPILELEVK